MAGTTVTDDDRQRTGSARNVIFAAPADDPRARRPVDVGVLVVSLVVTVLAGWAHRAPSDFDRRVFDAFDDGLPGWLRGTATVAFALASVYVLVLTVGIALFGKGRAAVVRDIVLAEVIAVGVIVTAAYLAGPEFPDMAPEFHELDGFPSYPVPRLVMLVAAIRVAGPYLSVPMRNVGRRLVAVASLSAVVLTYGTVSSVIGGLAAGAASAAVIQLAFGSGRGIPSKARILAALREANVPAEDVEFLPVQPVGTSLVGARLNDGSRALVKVYGRDAADAAIASRLWRAIWYRNSEHALFATSEQLAEHESLLLLASERAGAPTVRLVAWSRASTDDTVLVMEWVDGVRLTGLGPDDLDDEALDRIWDALRQFHDAGVAHGQLSADRIVVGEERVLLVDLTAARILPDGDDLRADVAQMLAATAVVVGEQRAIAAARRHLGDDRLLDALSQLQTPALPRQLQQDVRDADLSIKDLRAAVADELGTSAPELAQLQRVSWGSVAMAALTLFAASSLIGSLTDIGLDTIAEELGSAIWVWVAVAFVLAQLTNVGEYITLVGVVGSPVPFGPTMLFRYALSFISLAVPSEAGAIAMNVRYQQKLGVPAAAAIAQGPLLTIVSKGFDVLLLLVTARFAGAAFDSDQLDFGPALKLILVVVVVAVVAVVVVFAVPQLRARMMPRLREGFSAVKESVTDPERLLKIVSGTLLQKVLFALTLAASVAAFGGSLRFGEAVFVNCAVSLFVGLVPVPGGIGIAETALTAGLISVGIPEEAAFAAALTHRIVTAYLPPVVGWWASRWLTARDYL
jgi:uncharacterized membrane protein YbhN (UPF0104 family)/tRNA A-37 threonylcarbamoyl transferase component Bud32